MVFSYDQLCLFVPVFIGNSTSFAVFISTSNYNVSVCDCYTYTSVISCAESIVYVECYLVSYCCNCGSVFKLCVAVIVRQYILCNISANKLHIIQRQITVVLNEYLCTSHIRSGDCTILNCDSGTLK